MRFTRSIVGLATTGLVGATLALAAPAANATEVRATTTTLQAQSTTITYGDTVDMQATVTDSTGAVVTDGTVTLYAADASGAWAPVASVDAGSYAVFYDVKPKQNTAYKAAYSGYTATATYQNTFTASEAAPTNVGVARKLTLKNPRGTFIKGKVAPKYTGKVLVLKKVGKKWKKFRTLKAKKSRFTITLPASRKRTFWNFVVPGNSQYETAVNGGSTIAYRTAVSARIG